MEKLALIIRAQGLTEEDLEALLCRAEGVNINGLVVTREGTTADGKGIWRILRVSG